MSDRSFEKINIKILQLKAYKKSKQLGIPYSDALLLVIKEIAADS